MHSIEKLLQHLIHYFCSTNLKGVNKYIRKKGQTMQNPTIIHEIKGEIIYQSPSCIIQCIEEIRL